MVVKRSELIIFVVGRNIRTPPEAEIQRKVGRHLPIILHKAIYVRPSKIVDGGRLSSIHTGWRTQ